MATSDYGNTVNYNVTISQKRTLCIHCNAWDCKDSCCTGKNKIKNSSACYSRGAFLIYRKAIR